VLLCGRSKVGATGSTAINTDAIYIPVNNPKQAHFIWHTAEVTMELPRAPQYLKQERAGVIAVATEINRLGLIWRELMMVDVGIDGQVEFVNQAGQATGQTIAIQVKSGRSYFHDHGDCWHFYPDVKHRFYWERFPIPVIVALHAPEHGETYWTDARLALRSPETSGLPYIRIPKENRLEDVTAESLFATAGAYATPALPLNEVLLLLAGKTVADNPSFPVSYLDLFLNGLTNISRSIYYGMDLTYELAERLSSEEYITIGAIEHEFTFGFINLLVEQHLAEVDISDCLIEWLDRQKHPTFIAPLTSRGRALVRLADQTQDDFQAKGKLVNPSRVGVTQEAYVQVLITPSHERKIPVASKFAELIRNETL
jgi:hypothetical protein